MGNSVLPMLIIRLSKLLFINMLTSKVSEIGKNCESIKTLSPLMLNKVTKPIGGLKIEPGNKIDHSAWLTSP